MSMFLTSEEKAMLSGERGKSVRKAMEILTALGKIFGAKKLIPVSSVQIAGVSFDNLGDSGLEWLSEIAEDGRVKVLTTLNPAGMDIDNWRVMGIDPIFAQQQTRVIEAFERMGVTTTCTCTPYLVGNLPIFGEHIAWSESSAVCFANSVLGACTNREGGPSAIAAALTGRTPEYGMHLAENRKPNLEFLVQCRLTDNCDFGVLGQVVGKIMEKSGKKLVPMIRNVTSATLENLKSFSASIATYGGAAIFHMQGITPSASSTVEPVEQYCIDQYDMDAARKSMFDNDPDNEIDFVSLGCPHLSIREIEIIANLVKGRKVKRTFWITTARPTKQISDKMGYTRIIEESGAIIAADTCCVVAPIRGRFKMLATDSAKACYYASSKNQFSTRIMEFEQVVQEALR